MTKTSRSQRIKTIAIVPLLQSQMGWIYVYHHRHKLKNQILTRTVPETEPKTPTTPRRNWPASFEYPVSSLPPLLTRTLSDPLIQIRNTEAKEIIFGLFNKMLPITGLYPSSREYLLGVDSIFKMWKHLLVINGNDGRVRAFVYYYYYVYFKK